MIVHVLWWASIALEALTIAVFVRRGLHRGYPWFCAYLGFSVARDLTLNFLGDPSSSRAYAIGWMSTEPCITVLQLMVAYELFSRIGSHYRNFRQIGRPLLLASAGLAALICAGTLGKEFAGVDWRQPLMHLVFIEKRWVSSVITAFLVFTALFFTIYSSPIRRNVIVHGRLLAIYFAGSAGLILVMNYVASTAENRLRASAAQLILDLICLALWIVLMQPKGEAWEQPARVSDQEAEATVRRAEALADIAKKAKRN